MNLDELRSVQNRERATDSLQELRDSFYADVADYVEGLRDERDRRATEADDPFSDPEVSRLTDEIEMAEQVAEAIYERRVGKIVKQASLSAAGMQGDRDGLTDEEQTLYADLVDRIQENKRHVLDVLAGEVEPASVGDESAEPASPDGPADAPPEPDSTPASGDARRETTTAGEDAAGGDPDSEREAATDDRSSEDATDDDAPAVDRETVRIVRDVGEIFGVDERTYTLEADDVVQLPEENAAPLVEREAAERLE